MPVWVLPMLAGLLVSISIAMYIVMSKPATEDPETLAAKRFGLTKDQYNGLFSKSDRIARTHVATDQDLDEARRDFNSGNPFLRQASMGTFVALGRHSPHTAEGISMAKQMLADPDADTKVNAIMDLKGLGDPSWKAAAQGLLNDPNPAVREEVQTLLSRK